MRRLPTRPAALLGAVAIAIVAALPGHVAGGPGPGVGRPAQAQAAVAGSVLVVVARPDDLTEGDTVVLDRFRTLGLDPVVADDSRVAPSDATGTELVYVAQSAKHWFAATRGMAVVTVPLWVADSRLFDDYGLTGPRRGTDQGDRRATEIRVLAPGHPVAAGRSGRVAVQADGGRLSWGEPTAEATTIATVGPHPAVFAVASGDDLSTGEPAPGCRFTFPVSDTGVLTFTPDAWGMFDAAVTWLSAGCPQPAPPDLPGDGVEHVVVISVDGLNPDAIAELGSAGAPTFHRLVDEGASTLNARSMVELTRTLPNHTSMVTGRRIALPGGHGITFNSDDGTTVHDNAGEYVSSAFAVVHDAGGSTSFYASKGKLDLLDRSWNGTHGAADVTDTDDGRDKIDVYVRSWNSARLADLLTTRLSANPSSMSFLHLRDPDHVGHRQGFMSQEYLDAVVVVDGLIGAVLDTVSADPELATSTVVVVTSDHGGTGTSHTNPRIPEDYTIPMFVWGAGVDHGVDLYALNSDRNDPGTEQPPYDNGMRPIRNGAVPNLVTELLGLGPVPGSQVNTDQSLGLTTP